MPRQTSPSTRLRLAGLVAIVVLGLPAMVTGLPAAEPTPSFPSVDGIAPPPEEAPAPEPAPLRAPEPLPCPPPSRCGLIPVCRRVPVTITKPHTEYRMETELVCEPGCGGLRGCLLRHTGSDCNHCDTATVRTKKRLVKKVTDQKVASYEYKVFWVCRACAGFGGHCPRDR